MQLIHCDFDSVVVEISFDEPIFEHVIREGQDFTTIDIANCTHTDVSGLPQLPQLRTLVEVPWNCEPRIIFDETSVEEISLPELFLPVLVFPAQAPVPKIRDFIPQFELNTEAYMQNGFVNKSHVAIAETIYARDHRLLSLELKPIDYNPITGEIRFVRSAKLKVTTLNADVRTTLEQKTRHRSIQYDALIANEILNSEFYSSLYVPPTEIEMIIIAGSTYSTQLDSLIFWKKRKGFKVDLQTYSGLGGSRTSVDNYIQGRYDADDVDFILLVGDAGDIPTFTGGRSSSGSDNPYTELSGSDYIPDAFIGRFSLGSAAQVTELSQRTIKYENFAFGSATAWTAKVCLPATDDGSYHTLAENTQRYVTTTRFTPAGYTQIDTIWAYSLGGTTAGTQVINAINNGRMIVNYTGHGANTYWDAPRVTIANIEALTNQGMYPFIVSNACITGTFDTYAECFMEAWIRKSGKGAIGSIGASNNSYWNEDDIFERRMYDSVFVADWMFTGGMRLKGLMGVYNAYPSNAEYYFDMYNLFSDPSIALWYNVPQALTVSHIATVLPGDGAATVTVTSGGSAVQNALVCITNDDAIHSAEYTSSAGTISLPYTGAVMGDTLYVTVTAYKKIPYTGYIVVQGNAPNIIYNANTLFDNGTLGSSGDSDSSPDAGETMAINVSLRNTGTIIANSVTATLSTASSAATITDNTSSFGNIAVGATASALDPYVVRFGNVTDSTAVTFNLVITDAAARTWNAQFTVYVRAPKLSHYSIITTDASDGDGYYEPGEDVTVSIEIANAGGDHSRTLNGTLTEPDANISLITATSAYPNIAPASHAANSTTYRLRIGSSCPTPYSAQIIHTALDSRGYTTVDTFPILIGTGGLFDGAETGSALWTFESIWHISQYRKTSGSQSFYFGQEISSDKPFMYRDSLNASMRTANPIILTANPALTFWTFHEFEYNYDSGYVEISDDGTTWTRLLSLNGFSEGWKFCYVDLSPYGGAGDAIYVRFRAKTDNGLRCHGWFIDDISINSRKNAYAGAGDVFPRALASGESASFKAIFASPSGYTPTSATVYIDGIAHSLTSESGTATTGLTYSYSISSLGLGSHSYYFAFVYSGETFRVPATGQFSGPFIGAPVVSYDVSTTNCSFTTNTAASGFYQNWSWGQVTYGPSTIPYGSRCWATVPTGQYSDSSTSRLTTPSFTIPASGIGAQLVIWHWYRMQPSTTQQTHDGGNVKLSISGGTPFTIFPQSGYDGVSSQYNLFIRYEPAFADTYDAMWQEECFDLSPWAGQTVQLNFDFGSSSRTRDAGWYINRVGIYSIMPTDICEPFASQKTPRTSEIQVSPNPFNAACEINFSSFTDTPQKLEIYDISGKLVHDKQLLKFETSVVWHPKDDIPAGIYLVKVVGNSSVKSIRTVYLK